MRTAICCDVIPTSVPNKLGLLPFSLLYILDPKSAMASKPTPDLDDMLGSILDSGLESSPSKRLIVVSNRLPVTISKDANGEYSFKMSSGGLVAALSGCKKYLDFVWIGWTGLYIPPEDRPLVDRRLRDEHKCQAVYLDDDLADRHYNGFSNSILWPLLHYQSC